MFGFDVLGCWDSEKNWKGVDGEWGFGKWLSLFVVLDLRKVRV
jgi:hypothetical protein